MADSSGAITDLLLAHSRGEGILALEESARIFGKSSDHRLGGTLDALARARGVKAN